MGLPSAKRLFSKEIGASDRGDGENFRSPYIVIEFNGRFHRMRTLFFDIDGTLLITQRAGSGALLRAMEDEFGFEIPEDDADAIRTVADAVTYINNNQA